MAAAVPLEGHHKSHYHRQAARKERTTVRQPSFSDSDDEVRSTGFRAPAPVATAAPADLSIDEVMSGLATHLANFGTQVARLAKVAPTAQYNGGLQAPEPEAKTQFTATATFKQKVLETDLIDDVTGVPTLKLVAGKNLKLVFDQPKVGKMLADGELSAVLEKIDMTVLAPTAEDLRVSFIGVPTEVPGEPLTHHISGAALAAKDGVVSFTPLDKPFDADKQVVLEENGHCILPANLEKTYHRVEVLGIAVVPMGTPIANCALDHAEKKGLTFDQRKSADGKTFLELPLSDFDETYEPETRSFFARELPVFDTSALEIHVSPKPYEDLDGNPLAASFGPDAEGYVTLNGECKFTVRTFKLTDTPATTSA